MTVKYYRNKMSLLKDLSDKVTGLDVNKSAFLPVFGFVDVEGVQYLCNNAVSFAEKFNSRFGDIISAKGTRTAGSRRSFLIEFLEGNKAPVKKETVVEDTIEDTPVGDLKEALDEVAQEIVEETVVFDLDYAKSLEEADTKKAAKDALESYGRTLNVELVKNKSFSNMLKDLQEALTE